MISVTQIITCVIIHLKLDILECEVKWTLESITMNKTSGGVENGTPRLDRWTGLGRP